MTAIVCEQSDITKALAIVAAAHGMVTLLLIVALFVVAYRRVIPRRLSAREAWPNFLHAYDTAGTGKLHPQTSISRLLIGAGSEAGGNPDAFVLETFDGTSPAQMNCPAGSATAPSTTGAVTFTSDLPVHVMCVGLGRSGEREETSAPLEP